MSPIHRISHKRIEGKQQKFCLLVKHNLGKNLRIYPVKIIEKNKENYTVLWNCGCQDTWNKTEDMVDDAPNLLWLQIMWGVSPSLRVTCPNGTQDFSNPIGSIYRARRTDGFQGLVKGGKSWDSSYSPYINDIKVTDGGFLDTTYGHWIFFQLGYQWYKFNITEPVAPETITINGIMEAVKSIMIQKGISYFIAPGSRTSRSMTGDHDYWQWVYEIVYRDGDTEELVGGLTTLKQLKEQLKGYSIKDILYIDINVEHIAVECEKASYMGRKDAASIHDHNETLAHIDVSGKKYGGM